MSGDKYVFVEPTSRLKSTEVGFDSRGRRVFGIWNKDEFIERILKGDYSVHRMTKADEGRWDSLADTYYGDARLSWVLRAANNIIDFVNDAPAGTEIKVPDRSLVEAYMRAN